MAKPYKVTIESWRRIASSSNAGLGFYITGKFVGHPEFGTQYGHTSWVEKWTPLESGNVEIETRNSIYVLDGVEYETPTAD